MSGTTMGIGSEDIGSEDIGAGDIGAGDVGVGGRTAIGTVTAHAVIRTAAGRGGTTRLETLRSDPPLTLRRTGPARVHLVGSGAGPLGGDHLTLDIDVAPGTSLEVRSVAATLVLPGPAAAFSTPACSTPADSLTTIRARVGAGASLRFSPEPIVLAAGCTHRLAVRLSLAADAEVFWREEIVFGRYGERPGRCHSRFDVTVDDLPLLRQDLLIGDPSVEGSPAVYGNARCVGSTLFAGPKWTAAAIPDESRRHGCREGCAAIGDGWAALPLAGPGVLASALAGDAVELRARLAHAEEAAERMAAGSPGS